jgi:hypothetical protein
MHESVPQDSILGPPLFLLYINNVIENVQGAKLVLFADDANLLITGKDGFDLQHKIINVMGITHSRASTYDHIHLLQILQVMYNKCVIADSANYI